MTSPRTYAYIQALLKRGEAVRAVERMQKHALDSATFEQVWEKELREAWYIVETAADKGAVRIFERNHPVFKHRPIQTYFISKGFGWADTSEGGTLEWFHKPEMK